jgi:hypothetical protein
MTARFVISSEGDLEHYVKYLTELVKPAKNAKQSADPFPTHVEASFPSEALMHIFMDNLFKSFLKNNIPRNRGLNIQLRILSASLDEPDPPCDSGF